MYKLSNDAIDLISSFIKDSNKNDYRITSKNEMIEFCFSISLLTGFAKKDKNNNQTDIEKINSVLNEIQSNLDNIDYDDLNQRLGL